MEQARPLWMWLTGVVIVGLLAVSLIVALSPFIRAAFMYAGVGRTTVYCINLKYQTPSGYLVRNSDTDCFQWSSDLLAQHREAVLDCDRRYSDTDTLFRDCLLDLGYLPPGIVKS